MTVKTERFSALSQAVRKAVPIGTYTGMPLSLVTALAAYSSMGSYFWDCCQSEQKKRLDELRAAMKGIVDDPTPYVRIFHGPAAGKWAKFKIVPARYSLANPDEKDRALQGMRVTSHLRVGLCLTEGTRLWSSDAGWSTNWSAWHHFLASAEIQLAVGAADLYRCLLATSGQADLALMRYFADEGKTEPPAYCYWILACQAALCQQFHEDEIVKGYVFPIGKLLQMRVKGFEALKKSCFTDQQSETAYTCGICLRRHLQKTPLDSLTEELRAIKIASIVNDDKRD